MNPSDILRENKMLVKGDNVCAGTANTRWNERVK
jgi:hypothetical protein